MRASTAYFVGAGTIVAAIAIGLGGGIVAGNIMNPVSPKQGPDTSKIAQRADAKPATTEAPSERLQYLTGSQAFGAMVAAPAQAEAKSDAKAESKPEAKSEAVKPDTQTTQANAEQPAQQPSQAAAVEPPKPPPASPPQVAKPAERQASTEPSSSSDNAYAKARDSDVKRATSERRRTERRERWAERRHYDFREPRGMRDRTDWDDVARNIREDADAREVPSRPRGGFPQIRLFGDDD
ncbi:MULTISPECIES: hypothetical protein [Bradyrhizobium]|jgi:hypothetical protein|uniref:Uncharacterized protein n=1 Tax=Bradyrhizobium canariense TaxID=255045 RepID=A0A1X3F5L8_9BRAD|nr:MULTISPECIES: hypothetical protein [Bradyrhizobium]MBM7485790.1 type IV secretory pathway VirB10-like protein [Bradyrhizobium canariense]OSI24147.1 hypothetical protein BST65_19780 [Bradyrhizobium canariense]OSI27373.1 hypothetical protein BST66_34655 [Bradyrhizobium canariense]OSI39047.1 hypothetical protein BSZ20_31650 [Bradyrhizobium canariense]OSI43169.1 hypothetical protein BST67_34230 [Bradyrhizobium canariense]